MSGFDRSLGASALHRGFVVALFGLLASVTNGSTPEWASAAGLCGDADCSGSVSASDALALLQRAVGTISAVACPIQCVGGEVIGLPPAGLVVCGDVNCSESVTASDALLTLKAAVGTAVPMQCGTECSGVSTTTSTTLPQSTDDESALAVVAAAQAVLALFENPLDESAVRSLRDSAAYTRRLVEADSSGTLGALWVALDSVDSGNELGRALDGCTTSGGGTTSFVDCALGDATELDGSITGAGNDYSFSFTFVITTPLGTTTITLSGEVTVTTSAIAGTLSTEATTLTSGNTSAMTATQVIDVGLTAGCPTSGTLETSYHVVEKDGPTTTRDESSSFTATFGPACGDVSFGGATTTTTSTTTTTLGGQSPYAPKALGIVTAVHDLYDLGTGNATDGDKLDHVFMMIDDASVLAALDSTNSLLIVGVIGRVVEQPDPNCAQRVGTSTLYTNCQVDFGRWTLNGGIDVSGDDVTVNFNFVDGANTMRTVAGTVTLTDTALSGSFDGLLLSTSGILTSRTETAMQFALGLESRCARSGALTVPYTLRTFVNSDEVTTTPGEYSAAYGPACGQVAFP